MGLLIGLSVQLVPYCQKAVYLRRGIAHRVKRTICLKDINGILTPRDYSSG